MVRECIGLALAPNPSPAGRGVGGEGAFPQNKSLLRSRGCKTIAIFVVATLAINAAVALLLDEFHPELRDPEYARRISSLKDRVAEYPQRPLVLVLGSSRTAMGIRPGEWEACRPARAASSDPLLFNLSLIGGGPLLEMIVTQRIFADGIKPRAILLEYWPPLFNEDRANTFGVSIDRLGTRDRAVLQAYSANSESMERNLQSDSLNPLYSSRQRILSQLFPKWIPAKQRIDWMWNDIDDWGWKPGCDFKPGPSESRAILLAQAQDVFKKLFAEYRIDPREDRAFRNAIELASNNGVEVCLIYMPESSEFRSRYPHAIEKAAREHFAQLTHELGVPAIDARTWMEDGFFSDGFHLTRIGAAEFTMKLCPAIDATLLNSKH
jgi:hypothetical protein